MKDPKHLSADSQDHTGPTAIGHQVVTSREIARLAANMKLLASKMEAVSETQTVLIRQFQCDMTAYDLLQEEVSDMVLNDSEATDE